MNVADLSGSTEWTIYQIFLDIPLSVLGSCWSSHTVGRGWEEVGRATSLNFVTAHCTVIGNHLFDMRYILYIFVRSYQLWRCTVETLASNHIPFQPDRYLKGVENETGRSQCKPSLVAFLLLLVKANHLTLIVVLLTNLLFSPLVTDII